MDARRLPTIQTAPQVLYSNREPPLEIRHVQGLTTGDDVGYVTFSTSSPPMRRTYRSFGRTHLSPLFLSLVPPSFRQPDDSREHDLSHPVVPRQPALSHQVLEGVHAHAHAGKSGRVLEGPQQGKGRRIWRGYEKDSNVSNPVHFLLVDILVAMTDSIKTIISGRTFASR